MGHKAKLGLMQPTGTESAPTAASSRIGLPGRDATFRPNIIMARHQSKHRRRGSKSLRNVGYRLSLFDWLRGRVAVASSWMRRFEYFVPEATAAEAKPVWRSPVWLAAALGLAMVFFWSYWPVFTDLWATWGREADYSHGFLVGPVALAFLWLRRDSCPPFNGWLSIGGLSLLAASALVRIAGALWFIEAVQGWSMLLWLAGCCWLLGGFAMLRFCLPSICFLTFMIPLPFRAEGLLSLPLQRIATQLSCWILQCLGQPAISEGNVVLINDTRLMVAEACSGLRIFMSILALAYAYCVLIDKPWWTRMVLALSVLPIALLTNALRIVATGLTHEWVSSYAANVFAHDLAGWLMLPVAGGLMYGVLAYLAVIVVEIETVSARELLGPKAR